MFNREPVLWLAAVQAVIGLVISFGLELSGEQIGAIMAVSAGLLGLVARQQVSPVGSHHDDRGHVDALTLVVMVVVAIIVVIVMAAI